MTQTPLVTSEPSNQSTKQFPKNKDNHTPPSNHVCSSVSHPPAQYSILLPTRPTLIPMKRRIRAPAMYADPHARRWFTCTNLHHPLCAVHIRIFTLHIFAQRAVIAPTAVLGTALGTDPEAVVVVWCLCIVFGVAAQRAFGAPIVVFGTAVGADPEVGEGFSGHGVGVLVGCRLR
jgi:hypothetical protein